MPSEFKENAEDLNTGDPVQVDVNAPTPDEELEPFLVRRDLPSFDLSGADRIADLRRSRAELDSYEQAAEPDVEAIRARLDAAEAPVRDTFRGRGEKQNAVLQLQQHAPTDLRRLLDENARLNAALDEVHERWGAAEQDRERAERERDEVRSEASRLYRSLQQTAKRVEDDRDALAATVEALSARLAAKNAELDKVIREAAADKARVSAVRDVITPKNPDWKPLSERYPEHFTPDTPEESARKKGWGQGVALLTQQIQHALDGPEMPRPPAEEPDEPEPDLTLIPADLIVRDPEICSGRPTMRGTRILAEMVAGHLAAGTTWEELHEWYPSMPVPAAQPLASGPETAGTGSGRGTGVAETPGTAEPSIAWRGEACEHQPEWRCSAHGECRGCECACFTYLPSLPVPSTEEER